MNIVVDENIPMADTLFSVLGKVTKLGGRKISREDLIDVDVLLVRSVTKVNESLLSGTSVKFVGTCTIGTDHIDLAYLSENNIGFSSAPGCNARGVVQYVISTLARLNRLEPTQKVGIVGCGNVGGRLYRQLKTLGFDCYCYDPHLDQSEIPDLSSFDSIFDCDIVCVHTPLVKDGDYPTESMFGYTEFKKLKPACLLLNAGRGEVVNNSELLDYLSSHDDLQVVLDVWDAEPAINAKLLSEVVFGSPHIAGYSYEGKINGSTMIFSALSKHLGKDDDWIAANVQSVEQKAFGDPIALRSDSLVDAILESYDVAIDNATLREAVNELPSSFDKLRKTYRKRREFTHYSFPAGFDQGNASTAAYMEALGFVRADSF